MSSRNPQNVLARYSQGRTDDIEKIYLHAVSGPDPSLLNVAGAPGAGTSEVLRGVFDRLFFEQRFVVPFYFSLRAEDGDARSAAARYLYEFLLQVIAFRRRDPAMIAASPDICDLRELAPLSDAAWVSQLCEECNESGPLNDDRAFIRSAISAPLRAAAAAKMRVCVIIDDLHEAPPLRGGESLLAEIATFASSARSPVILGSRRKFRNVVNYGRKYNIEPLGLERSGETIDETARSLDVRISEQARDLLAVQMEGRLSFIQSVLSASRDRRTDIEDYRTLQQIYGELLTAGAIGDHFDEAYFSTLR